MVGAVDWTTVTVAGAFAVGAAVGTLATIRVLRYLLSYLRREQDGDDHSSSSS